MEADIETSLRNLRTDCIDLYQVHNPSMEQLDTVIGAGGALEALFAARDAGKIGHIGITAHSLTVSNVRLSLTGLKRSCSLITLLKASANPCCKNAETGISGLSQ